MNIEYLKQVTTIILVGNVIDIGFFLGSIFFLAQTQYFSADLGAFLSDYGLIVMAALLVTQVTGQIISRVMQ